jgi:hypothetical protein
MEGKNQLLQTDEDAVSRQCDQWPAGLPDGFFSNQKFQFGHMLECPKFENIDIFYRHFEYLTDIWDIL